MHWSQCQTHPCHRFIDATTPNYPFVWSTRHSQSSQLIIIQNIRHLTIQLQLLLWPSDPVFNEKKMPLFMQFFNTNINIWWISLTCLLSNPNLHRRHYCFWHFLWVFRFLPLPFLQYYHLWLVVIDRNMDPIDDFRISAMKIFFFCSDSFLSR